MLQPGAPSSPAQGELQHLQIVEWAGRVVLGGSRVGSLASRGHPGRRPLPAPALLLAVHRPQMASASPHWHAYRCGVDGSSASPEGVAVTQPACTFLACQPTAQPWLLGLPSAQSPKLEAPHLFQFGLCALLVDMGGQPLCLEKSRQGWE